MTRRRGFTLPEVLIAVVLLGIVGLGITRILISQTRFFTRSTSARDARAVSRNVLNLVRNEMRMIEPLGIVSASPSILMVHVPYAVGVNCSSSTVTFMPVDSLIWATARFAGYAYRDTALNATYTYVSSATAPSAGSAGDCTGQGITPVTGGPLLQMSPTLPTLAAGAPVMLFQTVAYYFANSTLVPGRTALWRRVANGATEEVAVPFDASSGFRFYVSGGTTSQAAAPGTLSTITGIELVLTGQSERNSPGTGVPESSEGRVSIFFRNAVQ